MSELRLTGERTLPRVPEENYWFRRHVAAYRFAAARVSGKAIDAGSGEGYGAALLARRATVVGLELDAAAAAHAARRYPRPRFVRADLCHLPVARADAVVALQVLEHLYCPAEFLASCRAALHPDGILVLSTPNRATFPAGLNPSHVHEYDARELGGLLEAHFGEVEVLGLDHRLPLRLLDRLLRPGLQQRLVRVPYPELPLWLRAILRTVRAWDFRVTPRPARALDLLAVCRAPLPPPALR